MQATPTHKPLFDNIKAVIEQAKKQIVRNVNTTMLFTYFQIGRMIVNDELNGKNRADYAEKIVRQLSIDLTRLYGKGYSKSNLEYMRQFYSTYEGRSHKIVQSPVGQSSFPFELSWTHYLQLMKIDSENERNFYEIESVQNNWSVRELQRQYQAALYERLASTRSKKKVLALAKQGQIIEKPIDTLKSPYILEFLELKKDSRYSENDLESAIINKLEHFMMELGKGFLFEGRQRRFNFEGDNFYVDLVFYNRLLKFFLLIDLKIGKLTHQDMGQMQMYVNYYDRMIKTADEHPTIGIILCREENKAVIEFTFPDAKKQVFSKEYKLYLPSREELKKQLT